MDEREKAEQRLLKVLRDTHCDAGAVDRLAMLLEQAAALGQRQIVNSVELRIEPGAGYVSWRTDSAKIRARLAEGAQS